MSSIGIIDWGIGGLGVVRELRSQYERNGRELPATFYFSDTGSTPYGLLSAIGLEARLRKVISFLRERGATKIFLACNAASTALAKLDDLQNVSGVIAPTIDAVAKLQKAKIRSVLVIGGRRTIRSRVYANALRARGFHVAQRIAQPLSGMIERGEQHTPAFMGAVAKILSGKTHYNALLLACTHYPAVLDAFENAFPGRVIDPLPAIARSIGKLQSSRNQQVFLTTGDPRAMQLAARKAWRIEIAPKKARF